MDFARTRGFAIVIGLVVGCGASSSPTAERPIRARPTFPNLAGGPVMVLGHVKDPGAVPWFRGMGIGFAILARGGALPDFDPNIEVRRSEFGKQRQAFARYKSEFEPEFELAPGDVVVVNPIIDARPFEILNEEVPEGIRD
jgi:hypothetical protein